MQDKRSEFNKRIANWLEPMPLPWTGHILDVKYVVWIVTKLLKKVIANGLLNYAKSMQQQTY